jgi:glycosyltransferase involved in cell wall biosynthesis
VNDTLTESGEAADRPFWSVMIPCWNPSRRFLNETLQSVLAAGVGPADMQIALVDDASPDFDGARFLRVLGFERVEFHRGSSRLGIAGNWNRCVALARGRWVHILHQDDRVRPDFYRSLRHGIASEPSVGAAFSQHVFIDEAGRLVREGHMPLRAAGILHDWLQHVFINLAIQCAAIVVRRDVMERLGGFDSRYAYCLDWDMWQRIAIAHAIWYEPAALAEQRLHRDSQSHLLQATPAKWREISAVIGRLGERLDPADAAWAKPALRQTYLRLAYRQFREALAVHRWQGALHEAVGCLRVARPSDFWAVARHRRRPETAFALAGPRQTDTGPRILLISEFFPFDLERSNFGAFQRLRILLEAAMAEGSVDLMFFWPLALPDQAEADRLLAALEAAWGFKGRIWFCPAPASAARASLSERSRELVWQLRGCVSFFRGRPTMQTSGALQGAVMRLVIRASRCDLVLAHSLGALAAVRRADIATPPIIADFPDLEHVRIRRAAALTAGRRQRLVAHAWAGLARWVEAALTRRCAAALVCSQVDRQRLAALAPGARIDIVANAVASRPAPALGDDPVAVFVGVLGYPPNLDAVRQLLDEIWPRVRARVPTARLLIVGEGGEGLRASIEQGRGIEVLGFMADLSPVYAAARMAVAPMRRGGGTRIKIIEAAAYGRACVATAVGAEGLAFSDGKSILIRDDAPAFAAACVELLAAKGKAESMGAAAQGIAIANYDRGRIVAEASQIIRSILPEPAARGMVR